MTIQSRTAWINPQVSAWNGDLDDWGRALTASLRCVGADRMDVIANSHCGPLTLANGASHTIALPSTASAEWIYVVVKCIGTAKVLTTGVNSTGSAISGTVPLFGTSFFPAYALISTQKITAASVSSGADGTEIEVLMLNVVLPTDARVSTATTN